MAATQYSLRTFLIIVAIVAAYFPCSRVYNAWYHSLIRSNHSSYYVELVLLPNLRDGDTLQDVRAQFDDVRLVAANDVRLNRNLALTWARKGLSIEKGDQFYLCSINTGAGAHLQFRQGKLVNFWYNGQTTPGYRMVSPPYPGQTRPNQWLTYGLLPGYLAFVAIGTITIQIVRKCGSHCWLLPVQRRSRSLESVRTRTRSNVA